MATDFEPDITLLLTNHINIIYPDIDAPAYVKKLLTTMGLKKDVESPTPHHSLWSEKDIWLITYGDSVMAEGEVPLATLKSFIDTHLKTIVNGVHILPFYPYSSDDGFSVINYVQVNDSLGDWSHVESIATEYRLMADLVINHCSSRSQWFENFKQGKDPGKDYFITVDPSTDTSSVTRPRTSPLLKEVETWDGGKKHVWCTFSHDQVDLDFSNPEVLLELVRIVRYYLDRGVGVFRLDAVAFLWKTLGTNCIHLPQTHEVIRLLRTLIEHFEPDTILITETNVPNHENLSYFGNANEAHAVYNFTLPPLLVHALIFGTSQYLKTWQMSMPPAQDGTFYFNFIASHDGLGLRPVEGLLHEEEIDRLVDVAKNFGARISWRSVSGGKDKPYEINVSLFDMLQGTDKGPDKWQLARHICAHAIMLSIEGVPGIYIHSFVGTHNYSDGVELTQQNRTINRYKWDKSDLDAKLDDENYSHGLVFSEMKKLIAVRNQQPAFHPNAVQFTLHLGDSIFGFWRQSQKRDQSIFCLHNVTNEDVEIPLSSINLISLNTWYDLVSGDAYEDFSQTIVLPPYGFIWLSNKR